MRRLVKERLGRKERRSNRNRGNWSLGIVVGLQQCWRIIDLALLGAIKSRVRVTVSQSRLYSNLHGRAKLYTNIHTYR